MCATLLTLISIVAWEKTSTRYLNLNCIIKLKQPDPLLSSRRRRVWNLSTIFGVLFQSSEKMTNHYKNSSSSSNDNNNDSNNKQQWNCNKNKRNENLENTFLKGTTKKRVVQNYASSNANHPVQAATNLKRVTLERLQVKSRDWGVAPNGKQVDFTAATCTT